MEQSAQNNFDLLQSLTAERGAAVFGVACMERMQKEQMPGTERWLLSFPSAISFGIRFSDAMIDSLKDGPTRQYTYHYRIVNREIDTISLLLVNRIQQLGYNAYPLGATQILDWENQVGELSHKWAAYNAGLGWYGRNNLLAHPQWGARVRYGTVLTDVPLPAGKPIEQSCGECYDCLAACPAQAIGTAPDMFDLEACAAKIRELRNKTNIGHYICGLCIKACSGKDRTYTSMRDKRENVFI